MDNFEGLLKSRLQEKSSNIVTSSVEIAGVKRQVRARRTLLASTLVACVAVLGFGAVQIIPSLDRAGHVEPAAAPTPYPGHPGEVNTSSPRSVECPQGEEDCTSFASGEHNGTEWTLYLFKAPDRLAEHGPREEWCEGLDLDGAGGGGCPAAIPAQAHVATGRDSGNSQPEDAVSGRLSHDVARVEIRVKGYESFEVPVIPGPTISGPEDPQVNYFLAFVPVDAKVEVAVFDEAGNLLQIQDAPDMSTLRELMRKIRSQA